MKQKKRAKQILAWSLTAAMLFTSGMMDWIPGVVKTASASSAITVDNAVLYADEFDSKLGDSGEYVTKDEITANLQSEEYKTQKITNDAEKTTNLYMDVNTALTFDVDCPDAVWGAYLVDSSDNNIASGNVVYEEMNAYQTYNRTAALRSSYNASTGKTSLTLYAGSAPTNSSQPFYVRIFMKGQGDTYIKFSVNILNPVTEYNIVGDPELVANHKKTYGTADQKTAGSGSATDIYKWSVDDTTMASVGENSGILTALANKGSVNLISKTDANISTNSTTENNFVAITRRGVTRQRNITITEQIPATKLTFHNSKYNVEAGNKLALLNRYDREPAKATDIYTWTSSNTSVATVSNGVVTGVKPGTATITIYAEDKSVNDTCEVTVYEKADSIELSRNGEEISGSLNLRYNNSVIINATESTSAATEDLVAESANSDLVKVEPVSTETNTNVKKFKITVLGEVTQKTDCLLTFRTDRTPESESTLPNNISKTCTISVYPKLADALTFYNGTEKITEDSISIFTGDSRTVSAKAEGVTPADQIKWNYTANNGYVSDETTNDDTSIKLNAVAKGTTTLTATSVSNSNITKQIGVTVLQSASAVSMSQSTISLNADNTYTLKANQTSANPDYASDETIIWNSDNTAAATVKDGVVTAVAKGTAYITATTSHSKKVATCKVVVFKAGNVKLTTTSMTGAYNATSPVTKTVTATVLDENQNPITNPVITWKSDNEAVATVNSSNSSSAVITCGKVGETTITATCENSVAVCNVKVTGNMSNITVTGLVTNQEFTYLPNGAVPDINAAVSYEEDSRKAESDDAYTLQENKDYTVSNTYTAGKNQGTYTYTFTGTGLYTGTKKTISYKVVPMDLSDFDLTLDEFTYDGTAKTPDINLTYKDGDNSQKLVKSTDFTVSYTANTNAGVNTAVATVTGRGNFKGTIIKNFTINPFPVENVTISPIANQTYTTNALTPSLTVKRGTVSMYASTDYTVDYTENVNAGTATATITGKGNYAGTQSVDFIILPRTISSASFASIPTQTYTGKEVTPMVAATYNKVDLENEKDFTLSYEKNIVYGTATTTVTGKGNYTGTTTRTFSIARSSFTDNTDIVIEDIKDQNYSATYMTPKLTITNGYITLTEGEDYKVSYSDNLNVGTANVTVTGLNNFTGTRATTFNIVMKDKFANAASEISITNQDSTELSNNTIFVDTGVTNYYDVKIGNGTNVCDDIVTVATDNTESKFTAVTQNVTDGLTATLAVTGKAPGTSKLYLNTMSGTLMKTINVVVYTPAKSISMYATDSDNNKMEITSKQVTMTQNHSLQLSAGFSPSNSTDLVKWSVSDTSKATVSEDGMLTLISPGTITVTATTLPTETGERGVVATSMVTIIENTPATSITFDKTSLNLKPKEYSTLKVTVAPENNTEQLVWKSSDENVATVTTAGKVTGIAKGTATITCSNFQGNVLATCNVNVYTPVTSLTMDASSKTIKTNEKVVLTVTLNPDTANENVEWTSSDETVAKVTATDSASTANTQTATVVGLKQGSCTIKAKSVSTGKTASCTISVTAEKYVDSTTVTKPAKAAIKSIKNVKSKSIQLKWAKVSGAKGYQVSYGLKKTFKGAKTKTVSAASYKSYKIKSLKKKKTYYVRVRAYKVVDGKKIYGSWSSSKKMKIKK